MSEPTPVAPRAAGRDGVRARLSKLGISDNRIFGPAEIIGLGGSLLIFLLVIVSYLYFLVPANSRLDTLQSERSLLQIELRTSQDTVNQNETTEASVQKITQSLGEFESNHLLSADRGRMGLYGSLNDLIRKNGLRNTSGPTYTSLEPSDSRSGTSGSKSANTKWQSIYPGIAISVTVEGQYQNLRHFIRDLEINSQLIIINSVELERSTETNNAPAPESGPPAGGRAALVSLRVEMTTYFQRAAQGDGTNNATVH